MRVDPAIVTVMLPQEIGTHWSFRTVEVVAVVATGAARFVVAEWLGFDLLFIVCAIAFWVGFLLLRTRSHPGILRRWGFSWQWSAEEARVFLPFFAAVLVACLVAYRVTGGMGGPAAGGTSSLSPANLVATLFLYPFWGVIQQFIVVAMMAGNVEIFVKNQEKRETIARLSASLLFAAVHLPYAGLAALGFLLGFVATSTYLRWRNLWIIGLFHGWVATFFYYFVLREDPWRVIVALARSPW